MEIRKAKKEEFDQIFMMGFDVWSEGSSENDYLTECQTSSKYRKGTWYVLSDDLKLISSLIVYDFGNNILGIGSISTPRSLRKKGYASKLISGVIKEIEKSSFGCSIFLYSDIEANFYEKFNFVKLPDNLQRYKTTTCMVYGKNIQQFLLNEINSPEYF